MKSRKNKRYTLLIITFIVPAMLFSQNLITTVESQMTCPAEVVIPVSVSNFDSVAAISLALMYETPVLEFDGYQNLHDSLAGGYTLVNTSNGKVIISWFSMTAATISDNDTLIELRFTSNGGVSDLIWDTVTPGNCEYSNYNGTVIPSNYVNGTATVYFVPDITSQPENSTIIEGENTSFDITATGEGLTYQWQLSTNGGTSWISLSNNYLYSGVTTETLSITGATLGMSGYVYRCVVTGTCLPAVTSGNALLTVNPLPQLITTAVPAIVVCEGSVNVPVTVTDCNGVGAISLTLEFDTAILNYTGYQNAHSELSSGSLIVNQAGNKLYISWASLTAANIGNATLLELNFTAQTGVSGLNWSTQIEGSCEYSDINGNVINSSYTDGTVTVQESPSILSNPANSTVVEGGATDFSITAAGTAISYQWQMSTNSGATWNNINNIPPYSGASTGTLHITGATTGMDGYLFRCLVYGSCPPPVYSSSAQLTVQPSPQVITTTIGSVPATMAATVTIPVTVTNCNGVAAISLTLEYDAGVLEYSGYQNPHPDLSSGFFIVNGTDGQCIISWASFTPANIGNDTLLELIFITHIGTTALIWDTNTPGNCEYSDNNGNIILSEYYNGTASFEGILVEPKAFLEGPFDTTGMKNGLNAGYLPLTQPYNVSPWNYQGGETVTFIPDVNAVDWILIELRETGGDASSAADSTVIARQAGFILNDGSIVQTNGSGPLEFRINVTQNLYLVLWHRNHLGIMSSNALTTNGGVYTFDFTTSETQAYGGNTAQKELAQGVWGMIAGDANAGGHVDNNDIILWKQEAGKNGYLSTDFDMNGQTNNIDKNDKWLENINKNSFVPE